MFLSPCNTKQYVVKCHLDGTDLIPYGSCEEGERKQKLRSTSDSIGADML